VTGGMWDSTWDDGPACRRTVSQEEHRQEHCRRQRINVFVLAREVGGGA
jgi:hypothetical protein